MNNFATLIVLAATVAALVPCDIAVARGNVATWVNIRAQSLPAKTTPAAPRSAPKPGPKAAPRFGPVGTKA